MLRIQQHVKATILDGQTVSTEVNAEGFAWMLIETPLGSETDPVTVQKLSGDGTTWLDAFTLADVTNRVKGLTPEEIAKIGPLCLFRLKVDAAVSGDKIYYCDMSS